MNGWVIYADLISAGLGLASAIVLGWPAIKGIRAKKYYETASRMQIEQADTDQRSAQIDMLTKRVQALQLAGAREALVSSVIGYGLLGASFVFLAVAALERNAGV